MTTLIVGLGNPGAQYENNRHNVGFMIIEALAQAFASFSFKKMANLLEAVSFEHQKEKIILAKPLTFMNLSGQAVRFLSDFYKILNGGLIVIHDDIDLEFGSIKIKKGGGNGGHNGLKSIDQHLGNDYWRVRIGVGRPERKEMVSSYVLGDFSQEQLDYISKIADTIVENFQLLITDKPKLLEQLNKLK